MSYYIIFYADSAKLGVFMFYQFDDEMVSVDYDKIKDNTLALGFVTAFELEKIYKHFDIPLQVVELCKSGNSFVNSTRAFNKCWFIKISYDSTVGIIVFKNMFLLVSIDDKRRINRDIFMNMISRVQTENAGVERLVLMFFDFLVGNDTFKLEDIRQDISKLEESVITNNVDEKFNISLLEIKKNILGIRHFYERLMDILEMLDDNENDVFDSEMHFSNSRDRIARLKSDADILTDSVVHLWDAYQASMEMELNRTMKVFTLVTTIFFPLTVIVGWYGMNFNYMPEIRWRYGYIYVICLSLLVIGLLVLWFKKKRWI